MEDRLGEEAEAPAFDPDSHVSFNVRNFESEAAAFLGDVINMVNDYCADGFDAFEDVIRNDQSLSNEAKVAILQGIETLYQYVQRAMDSNLEQWEHNALKKIFALPPGLLLPPSQARAASEAALYNPAEEQALDAELRELREKIDEANASCSGLKRELRALDREIGRCQGQAERMKAVLQPGGGENVGVMAGQIANVAARLQPLLAKAEQLQNQRRGPLISGRDERHALPGSSQGWLDNLQLGPPEDIARLRNSLRAQPAASSRSEPDSKSQASMHP